jgi:hypothetical protein
LLFLDAYGKTKFEPARNDDLINIHNHDILIVWKENMDFQRTLSLHTVIKYISKYASKAKGRLESYHCMVTRITDTLNPTNLGSFSYGWFHK